MKVGVFVEVLVAVAVAVLVGVTVGVAVPVGVGVTVGVRVGVGVGVGMAAKTEVPNPNALTTPSRPIITMAAANDRPLPVSGLKPMMTSVKSPAATAQVRCKTKVNVAPSMSSGSARINQTAAAPSGRNSS